MVTINGPFRYAMLNDAAASSSGQTNATQAGADPAGFASLLRQTQGSGVVEMAAPPQPPMTMTRPQTGEGDARDASTNAADTKTTGAAGSDDAAANKPTKSDEANDTAETDDTRATAASDAANRARALIKTRLRAADGAATASHGAKPAAGPTDGNDSGMMIDGANNPSAPTAPGANPPAIGAPIDPNVMYLTAPPRADAASGGQASGDAKTTAAADAGSAATELADTRSRPTGAHAGDLRADADAKAQPASAKDTAAPAGADFGTLLAEKRISETQTSGALTNVRDIAAAGASATPASASSPVHETAAPVAVPIPTPIDAPEFAQTLGAQLSVLARDGVQQAELHLNPAEMGPVSVQIVMDGTQARIDFGADMAATRQAIEAGLPELASALRDAGYTLAGGGVSQHAGSRSDGGRAGTGQDRDTSDRRSARVTESGGNVGSESMARVSAAARRIAARGGVDLYA